MVNLLCTAHGLSNLVKDLVKALGGVENIVANTKIIVTVFCEKSKARKLLMEEQQRRYRLQAIRKLSFPPEQRFAYIVEMMAGVEANEGALRAVVNDPEYEDSFMEDDKAWEVKDIISSI